MKGIVLWRREVFKFLTLLTLLKTAGSETLLFGMLMTTVVLPEGVVATVAVASPPLVGSTSFVSAGMGSRSLPGIGWM